jgi:galactokinase
MFATVSVAGRIEVLGNHTDYNGGRVLVAPTRTTVTVHIRGVRERRLSVISEAFPRPVSQPIDSIQRASGRSAWANYVLGAVQIGLSEWPRRGGLQIRVGGDLPMGAGLASSAALCVATLRGLAALARRRLPAATIADWAQRVENEFVGVPVGPLDPLSCATSRRGWLTHLDFAKSPRVKLLPMPKGWRLLVFDTGTRHVLRESDYAKRRAECAAAAAAMGIARLGLVTPAEFSRRARSLSPLLRRRARHVVEESARVDAATRLVKVRRDAASLGALLDASQRSSQENFENSDPAVELLVERLRKLPGVTGARLTGGGFGGAVIAWVRRADVGAVLVGLAADGTATPRLLDIA